MSATIIKRPLLDDSDTSDVDDEYLDNSYRDKPGTSRDMIRADSQIELVESERVVPADKLNFTYIVFYLLGISTVLPWNFFLMAEEYWMYKFRNVTDNSTTVLTPIQASIISDLTVAGSVPGTVFLVVNALVSHLIPLRVRIVGSMLIVFGFFVTTTAFVEVDTDSWQHEFYMAFQRSFSRVWWANRHEELPDNQLKVTGNFSRIHETDKNSKLWNSLHESPGSLRSQDSGFSDNEDSSHLRQSVRSSERFLNSIPSTPASTKSNATPPTVIRQRAGCPIPALKTTCQRLSFSVPSSPVSFTKECNIINQIERINQVTNSAISKIGDSDCKCPKSSTQQEVATRRKRVNNLKIRLSLIKSGSETSPLIFVDELRLHNNKTVLLGCVNKIPEDDNINMMTSNGNKEYYNNLNTPLRARDRSLFNVVSTSTPKARGDELNFSHCDIHTTSSSSRNTGITIPYYIEYETKRLNGHALPIQYWLNDIRMSYNHEVMSTLQTKSIAQEAFRNFKITTATVAKIIRQLQTRALVLQREFERVERLLKDRLTSDALVAAMDVIGSVDNFIKVLEKRSVFFAECHQDRRHFQDNIGHMGMIMRDLNISLGENHYLDAKALLEDIQVLKRFTLITLRLVFEQLIRVIVCNIENCLCDLLLRAHLNIVATLSNIDYTGFASLNDAFVKNNAIRVFIRICLDSKYSSIRALALRALATVCSSRLAIKQFGDAEGVEIVRNILRPDSSGHKRTEAERREAVSLLTQITAPWHGPDHIVSGLMDCTEKIVESLTDIVENTICCQTLLLCAASLNNLSRLETTSIYSIMSNETILKLKEAVERRGPGVSIFLFEQIMKMLQNMSINKKCHAHLANRTIVTFITSTFQSKFNAKFGSRAENEAHQKTIKAILHILSRLIHESVVGHQILEHNFVPVFSKIERNLHADHEYSKDISFVSHQMNESLSQKPPNRMIDNKVWDSPRMDQKLFFARQESYV